MLCDSNLSYLIKVRTLQLHEEVLIQVRHCKVVLAGSASGIAALEQRISFQAPPLRSLSIATTLWVALDSPLGMSLCAPALVHQSVS